MIIVKRSAMDDAKDVAALFDQYRQFYQQPTDINTALKFIEERLFNEDSIIFVARNCENGAENAVGFIQLYPTFSSISVQKSLILNDLFVTMGYRQSGVARQLMASAKEYADSINAKGLALQTAKDNLIAQKLYESLGYKRDDEFYSYFLTL